MAGTKATIKSLLKKMDEKQLSESEKTATIQKLARNVQIVGQEVLQSIWSQCQKAEQGSSFQHACVLSWARMANTMCSRNEKREQGKKIGDLWAQDKQREGEEEKQARCSESLKSELVQVSIFSCYKFDLILFPERQVLVRWSRWRLSTTHFGPQSLG